MYTNAMGINAKYNLKMDYNVNRNKANMHKRIRNDKNLKKEYIYLLMYNKISVFFQLHYGVFKSKSMNFGQEGFYRIFLNMSKKKSLDRDFNFYPKGPNIISELQQKF